MLKKYMKLALLFCAPVLGIILSRTSEISNRAHSVTASNQKYGDISYPHTAYFGSDFGTAILFLCLAAALFSMFVFSELRSRKTGGFIAALPIKKANVFTSVFLSGCLLIVLSFIPMCVIFFSRLNQISPGIYEAFSVYNRLDWAEEIIFDAWQNNIADAIRTFSVILCLYGGLTFVQTLFQKPIAAVCALTGGLGGSILCVMTLDKYLIVLGHEGIRALFFGGAGGGWHYIRYFLDYSPVDDTAVNAAVRFALLCGVITAAVFAAGLALYQNSGHRADFIFTFPIVKKITIAGITICSGCLCVYILFNLTGMDGLRLGQMNLLFIAGSVFAFVLTKKMFNILC